MITIREAAQSDLNQLTQLTIQLGYPTSTEQISHRLNGILTSQNDIILVAERNNNLLGWITAQATYRLSADPFVEIGGLVVDENIRGQGVGKKLIQSVADWAIQNKILNLRVRCNVIRLDTHQFYQHLGFTETKTQKVFKKAL